MAIAAVAWVVASVGFFWETTTSSAGSRPKADVGAGTIPSATRRDSSSSRASSSSRVRRGAGFLRMREGCRRMTLLLPSLLLRDVVTEEGELGREVLAVLGEAGGDDVVEEGVATEKGEYDKNGGEPE